MATMKHFSKPQVTGKNMRTLLAELREFGPMSARLFVLTLLIDVPVAFAVMSVMRAIVG